MHCLLCLIAPPLRKLKGHDKKMKDDYEDSSEGNCEE